MPLEANLLNILLGVISNGLYAILVAIGDQGNIKKIPNLQDAFRHDQDLSGILQKASATVAKSIALDNKEKEKIQMFLVSPEVDAVVRQIFAQQISSPKHENLKTISEEFEIALSRALGREDKNIKELGTRLYEDVLNACLQALSIAIKKGSLGTHEANSALRHRIILDELSSIRNRIDALSKTDGNSYQAFLNFELRYRDQVSARHRLIAPPQIDSARKLPIDQLYVAPTIVTYPQKKGGEPVRLKLAEFFSGIRRTVLLGNPGGGKSTLSLRLCYEAASKYGARLVGNKQLTPIVVVLREYGTEKKMRPVSILQFIESRANASYQVAPPSGAFEFLLTTGRVFVVFDGLDELLDTSHRREISADVESFCTLYPNVPILVTSREVGYEEAPLDKSSFETYRLTDFDDEQVADYTKKWFAADPDLTPYEQAQKARGFLADSEMVSDLRANPLMLALMCGIYRGEGYIPRNRPDVYEKCALMLFERWDKGRGIQVQLPFESHINPAMKFLALWIYSDEKLQSGVTETALIDKATDYLDASLFDNRDKAKTAATEFIRFCRGRAWVFTDVGTTKVGEHLYQFTHRTFLEYFAAGNLVRNNPTPEQLHQVLLPRIKKGEWDVVSQLAFQLQSKNTEAAGDLLLSKILQSIESSPLREADNLLFFAGRCLGFIIPKQRTVRDVCTACINTVLEPSPHLPVAVKRSGGVRDFSIDIISTLLNPAVENRQTVSDCVRDVITRHINGPDAAKAGRAADLLNSLGVISRHAGVRASGNLDLFQWEAVSTQITSACSERIRQLAEKNISVARDALLKGSISLPEFVQWHGIDSLFQDGTHSIFPNMMFAPIAAMLAQRVIAAPYIKEWAKDKTSLTNLEELGKVLETTTPPWLHTKPSSMDYMLSSHWMNTSEQQLDPGSPFTIDKLTSYMRFALFVILAIQIEIGPKVQGRLNTRNHVFAWIRECLQGRLLKRLDRRGHAKLQAAGFTDSQRALALKWIENNVHFVKPNSRRDRA